jgi:O-methyltransferase domain/Dimerisation domain
MATSLANRTVAQNEVPESDPVQLLLQVSTGYIVSACLWTAAELKVADHLRSGPKHVAEIASATGVTEDGLYRVLRVLAMKGIFAETDSRTFALTSPAEFLCSGHRNTQRDTVVWLSDPFHLHVNEELMHSMKTGQPAVERVTGKAVFEFFANDQVENVRFHNAMTNLSASFLPALFEAYDFSRFSTVVDVAGGHGYTICEILRRYPGVKGILFDLHPVVEGAEHRICELALESRCQMVGGDFFQSVPKGGDAYVMKMIIHDWDDERALVILKHCREALRGTPKGKLILLEMVLPPGNEFSPSKLIDIEMLLMTGGRERTAQEFRDLLARAGFRLTQIVPTKSPYCVVEAELAD